MIPFKLRWPSFDMMSRSRPHFIGPGVLTTIKFDRCEFTAKYKWDTHCSRWSAKWNWKHTEESVSSVVLCLAACVPHGAGGVLLLCDLAKGSVYWQDAGVLPGYQIHQLPMGNLSAWGFTEDKMFHTTLLHINHPPLLSHWAACNISAGDCAAL